LCKKHFFISPFYSYSCHDHHNQIEVNIASSTMSMLMDKENAIENAPLSFKAPTKGTGLGKAKAPQFQSPVVSSKNYLHNKFK